MLGKSGVSPLIAWVLLVGLGVALAALVTNWAIGNVKTFNPNYDDEFYCKDLAITINSICEIKNTGVFSVYKVIVQDSAGAEIEFTPALAPGQTDTIAGCSGFTYLPVTKDEEGGDVVCSLKKITAP